ncbi:MAG: PQQ-binding-like beta-propeller repeat protein [Saccharofermentans sp.]|nr:PQQ-binding-like beta-propeller repeat protein [Saccharofermentans sp.]
MKFKRVLCILLALFVLPGAVTCYAGSDVNDSRITHFKTPASHGDSDLLWGKRFGSSYKDAPGVPVVVDDTLLVTGGKKLLKLDALTGKTIKSVEMADAPSFGYTPLLYVNGVIYCPLDNGKIQAFDYKTMKSLWLYTDPDGGQSLTPITYDNGCIYTGFWNDEDLIANYVCIDVKDEDTKSAVEAKTAKWTYKNTGGFYWAGCAVVGDHVIFGGDDGTFYADRGSKLVSLNKNSGALTDSLDIVGDQRSTVTYADGKVYFTTKAGYLYSVTVTDAGEFDKQSLKQLYLGGASTSTPLIFNGRIYLGVQGEGFGSGYFKVINADTLSVIYSADTNGYPQGKFLLTDAYYKDTGKVYIYAACNGLPGGITVFADSAGQTVPETGELFMPSGRTSGYCISPVVCDENGTLFYKNDSGYVFAVRNKSFRVSIFRKIFRGIKILFARLFG